MKNNFNKYHRYRGDFVGFRVTKEENEMISRMARLAGMTKQDYIIARLECRDVVVVRNPKVYAGMKSLLTEIKEKLDAVIDLDETLEPELIETIDIVCNTLAKMADKRKEA